MKSPAIRLTLLILALLATPMPAQPRNGKFGELNPDAPPETKQFEFLVGEWHCKGKALNAEGKYEDGGEAKWIGYYILDGWAIQDDWISPMDDGRTFHGTNVRSFNPKKRKWDNRWLPAISLQWTYFEAEKKGDTMVMIGGRRKDGEGREILDRNTFYDIGPDSWKWRKDRSYDDGKTWTEGVALIEATRVK